MACALVSWVLLSFTQKPDKVAHPSLQGSTILRALQRVSVMLLHSETQVRTQAHTQADTHIYKNTKLQMYACKDTCIDSHRERHTHTPTYSKTDAHTL